MMKKLLLMAIVFSMVISLNAQFLDEDFSGGIPATWQTIDNSPNNAGNWIPGTEGTDKFAIFNSDALGDDIKPEDADLITDSIDCSAGTKIGLSLFHSYRHWESSKGEIFISNDGGVTWSSLYVTSSSSAGGTLLFDISTIAAGNPYVMLKFNYVGDYSYWWLLDDIKIYTPDNDDISMLTIDNEKFVNLNDAAVSFNGYIQNLGIDPITSFDINYSVDGGTPVSGTISGINVGFGETYEYTHPLSWSHTTIGDFSIEVTSGDVNGNTDSDLTNNSTTKEFTVFDEFVQRVPLYEIFTSSTCNPCKPGNENFHSIVDSKPQTEYVSIKYQQDFPGTGDPYATSESIAVRNYYGVNSIPRMEIDGLWDQNASSFTEALYSESKKAPAFVNLMASYNVNQSTKKVTVKVVGYSIQNFASSNYKMHAAIIENETTANIKSNGETKFEQVTKKMLPDNNGSSVTLSANTNFTFDLDYTFNGNYRLPSNGQSANYINLSTEHSVEGFDDLRVVVWVQDMTSKKVIQAFNAVIDTDSDGDGVPDAVANINIDGDGASDWAEMEDGSTNPNKNDVEIIEAIKNVEIVSNFNVFPNPATDVVNVNIETVNNKKITVEIVNVLGKTIQTKKVVENTASFNTSKLSSGIYMINAISEGKSIASTSVVLK